MLVSCDRKWKLFSSALVCSEKANITFVYNQGSDLGETLVNHTLVILCHFIM